MATLTIAQVQDGLRKKQFSAEELAKNALAHAEAENTKTNAYLTFSPERALAAAKRVDEALAKGDDPGALAGVPIAVKDVIVTKGLRTTCGSRLLDRLHAALRCHGDHAAGAGRRRHHRQDQLR